MIAALSSKNPAATPAQFFETSLVLLQHFVGCDHAAWYIYEFTTRSKLTVTLSRDYDLDPRVLSLMAEALPSHPYIRYYQSHPMTAVTLSDIRRRAQLAHHDRYEDLYRRAPTFITKSPCRLCCSPTELSGFWISEGKDQWRDRLDTRHRRRHDRHRMLEAVDFVEMRGVGDSERNRDHRP